MGKDTDFQRRQGMDYPRLAAAAAGAEFETEIQRQNQIVAIRLLHKQIEEKNLTIRKLEQDNAALVQLLRLTREGKT